MGTRPADELVLLEHVNLLCEEKRTDGDQFKLSMLRTDQLTGLINFEKALDRNIGLVLVSFLNEAVDVAYAFRLVHAMAYMNQKGRRYITLEELQQAKCNCTIVNSNKHPYHLIHYSGAMVYGWVNASDCEKI